MEKTQLVKQINLNCFIVPNHSQSYDDAPNYVKRSVDRKLEIIGIPNPKTGLFAQVWIHDAEHQCDNCTDHGYDQFVADALNISDRYDMYAPAAVPVDFLKDVKEGDTKEWTSLSGVKVTMKFEQLPFRYRHVGRFEEAVRYVTR